MAQPEESERGATEGLSERDAKEQRVLRLHIVKGSFPTDADGAARGLQRAMAPALWSTMPEELLWRVLHFVPAAKHFQWRSVSRKWLQVLTSGEFCNAVASCRLEEQRVVASATLVTHRGSGDDDMSTTSRFKVVDIIDLSSMLPSSFWKFGPYDVKAAGDGLVCIGNGKCGVGLYCVLNPVTRMCKVLPQVPFRPRVWLPPTRTTVTMVGYMTEDGEMDGEVYVATCDLAAGGGNWDLAVYQSARGWANPVRNPPVVAQCAGETFWFRKHRVHVTAPRPGGRLVEVAALDEPVEHSEMQYMNPEHMRAHLAVHRGALFFVKKLEVWRGSDLAMCVWRLARERLEWVVVARLDVAEMRRVTGVKCIWHIMPFNCLVWTAWAVREVLYFIAEGANEKRFMLGLNLDTGEWMLVDKVSGPIILSRLLELRQDLP